MRALMGLIKDRYGTYYAQKRVPDRLQVAVARVLKSDRPRQVFLKKSLGTKSLKEANVRGKPVQMEFDRTLAEAEALEKALPPARTALSATEISRMAEYTYARTLAWDERVRVGGRDELRNMLRQVRKDARAEGGDPDSIVPAYDYEDLPPFGLSLAQLTENRDQLVDDLRVMREALALGNTGAVEDHVREALSAFGVNLDPTSTHYRTLGSAVLSAYVRALEAIEKRNAGQPVDTPVLPVVLSQAHEPGTSGTVREALEGWKKSAQRPENTLLEHERAVRMFVELHGDMRVLGIKRSHARTFRDALQLVPRARSGKLQTAALPELAEYGRANPQLAKVSFRTVNKQLGAVQAIANWAQHNGLVPDDAPWSDPFHRMRLEEEDSTRSAFNPNELQQIFDAPLFTAQDIPMGGKGDAAVWLPLVGLFTGARQAEIAGLQASNVRTEHGSTVPLLFIVRDRKAGKRLKTRTSERVVPVHPELVRLGFLDYVAERARAGGNAWLFPTVAPDQRRALAAWSKWFGRYLRTTVGLADPDKVFHSFRHSFQDALRRATSDEELRDAIPGRSSGSKSVSRDYGAKSVLERWGVEKLNEVIGKVTFPGLDLSRVRAGRNTQPDEVENSRGKGRARAGATKKRKR